MSEPDPKLPDDLVESLARILAEVLVLERRAKATTDTEADPCRCGECDACQAAAERAWHRTHDEGGY